MEKSTKRWVLLYLAAAGGGVLLHFLYSWLPSPALALISPVRESVWEHGKLLYFPLLAVSLLVGRGGGGTGRTPWLLSTAAVFAAMQGAGYLYHVTLRGESLPVDLALYFALLGVGFLLPRALWPLGALIVWFTFFPPDTALFADLSGAVRTFLTIPV